MSKVPIPLRRTQLKTLSMFTIRFLFLFIIASALAVTGCKKQSGPATDSTIKPEHEQLLEVLESVQKKRMELVELRVYVKRITADVERQCEASRDKLDKVNTELAVLRDSYKSASKNAAGVVVSVDYEGENLSDAHFKQIVANKIQEKKNANARLDRYTSLGNSYDTQRQSIFVALDKLNSDANEAAENIRELLLGREIKGAGKILERVRKVNVAAITEVVRELENKKTLADSADSLAATGGGKNAEVESFLGNTQ
ncbi:MAG: hypothetical protein LBR07_04150 [Puniceicoccales bacterium]|jgi:hypothetical protein|nr:hypothetical protein [Puniceicoccales bacterium]